MRPFLLLGTRAEDVASDNEYEAMLAYSGLRPSQLRRVRLERDPLPRLDLDDWSGIILGGGPFNVSDPPTSKSTVQRRVESDLFRLLDAVVPADFPFLGACYGVGTIGVHQGGVVDNRYGEPVSRVPITLTGAGREDPVFGSLPSTFDAFVGHREAIATLPPGAVRLASSPSCPVQGFRIGNNVYATQFHPELDHHGLCLRVEVYKEHGYFPPEDAEAIKAMARHHAVEHPGRLLAAFVQRYRRLARGRRARDNRP